MMHDGGFLEQKRGSPIGFTLVVVGHAAALAALLFIKGPDIVSSEFGKTVIDFIEQPRPPEPPPPPPPQPKQEVRELPQRPTQIDMVPPVIDRIHTGPVVTGDPLPPIRDVLPEGPIVIPRPDAQPVPDPVRIEARFDPRYADALQPPYPPSEQRAQNEGQVRMRVTIGTDGRVKAVERLNATSDAFWSMAERHARSRWRFRPATVDGRPVESQKVMTLHFRLENA